MKLDEVYFDGMELVDEPQIITVGCCKVLNKYQDYIKKDDNQLAIDFNLPENEEFEVCKFHFKFKDKLYVPDKADLKNIVHSENDLSFEDIKTLFYISGWRYLTNNDDKVSKIWNEKEEDQFIIETYNDYMDVLNLYKNINLDIDKLNKFKKDFFDYLDNYISLN